MLSPLVTVVVVDVILSGIHCTLYATCLTKRTMHHHTRSRATSGTKNCATSAALCVLQLLRQLQQLHAIQTIHSLHHPGVLPGSFAENSSSKNLNNAKVITNFQALEKTCNYPHKLPPSSPATASHRSTLTLALSKYVL